MQLDMEPEPMEPEPAEPQGRDTHEPPGRPEDPARTENRGGAIYVLKNDKNDPGPRG
jgi:hypothetical protein